MSQEVDKVARREKLRAEGWPKTLSELFDRTGISFDRCARMTIDLQEEFVQGDRMESIVVHMKGHIAPAFNQIGIPTYWIYWPDNEASFARTRQDLIANDYKQGAATLYEIWPAAIDKVLPKRATSAFSPGLFNKMDEPTLTEITLDEDGVELLLVDGFFYEHCVTETILDAVKRGYLVALMEDGTDGPSEARLHVPELVEAGVIFLNSDEAIHTLKKRALQKPSFEI